MYTELQVCRPNIGFYGSYRNHTSGHLYGPLHCLSGANFSTKISMQFILQVVIVRISALICKLAEGQHTRVLAVWKVLLILAVLVDFWM